MVLEKTMDTRAAEKAVRNIFEEEERKSAMHMFLKEFLSHYHAAKAVYDYAEENTTKRYYLLEEFQEKLKGAAAAIESIDKNTGTLNKAGIIGRAIGVFLGMIENVAKFYEGKQHMKILHLDNDLTPKYVSKMLASCRIIGDSIKKYFEREKFREKFIEKRVRRIARRHKLPDDTKAFIVQALSHFLSE
ncbi:hypothetical protein GF361_00865 [Candidatus Woesearchaeota archaeon]|nr:hypothetical protein [Candidatus Woesearchaeota archaeon]